MTITRDPQNLYGLIEHTDIINDLDRQFQIFPDNMFDQRNTNQTAILFDVDERTTTLLPSSDRGSRQASYGKDTNFRTHALPLAYFKHEERIVPEDLLSVRRRGTPDGVETLDLVRLEKLTDMRRRWDQTAEFMKAKAIFTGQCVSPNAVVYADMFTEFGVTQDSVDFELGTATTDVAAKVRQVKRLMRDNLKNGGIMVQPTIYVPVDFFDALTSHATVKEAYKYYTATNQMAGKQPLRDDLGESFVYAGVEFRSLDGSFTLPDGTSSNLLEDGIGYAVPNVSGIYKSWHGPSNKLSTINGAVADVYAYEWRDAKDEGHDLEMEAAPLFVNTKPKATIKVLAGL